MLSDREFQFLFFVFGSGLEPVCNLPSTRSTLRYVSGTPLGGLFFQIRTITSGNVNFLAAVNICLFYVPCFFSPDNNHYIKVSFAIRS